MFYCEKCAEKNDWPQGILQSYGPCEVCGKRAVCSDVPSRCLPEVKPKTTVRRKSPAQEGRE